MKVTLAFPLASVGTLIVVPPPPKVPLAPEPGAVKVTFTPETGPPQALVTVATSGVPNAVPTCVAWPLPPLGEMVSGTVGSLVREKTAGPSPGLVSAVTVYEPAVQSAWKTLLVAWPLPFVSTVSVRVPVSVNVPLAPEAGATNVTLAFATPAPRPSRTRARSRVPNAVPTPVD